MEITGSILQPIISGNIKLSHGEVYLPQDRGSGGASNRFTSNRSVLPAGGVSQAFATGYMSRHFGSGPASLTTRNSQSSSTGNTAPVYQFSMCPFPYDISITKIDKFSLHFPQH